MAVIAILECQFKPGEEAAGAAWLRKILAATRAFDGCLGLEILQDHADPARFVVVERWASPEHDHAYRVWRAGEGRVSEGSELFATPLKLTVGTVREDI